VRHSFSSPPDPPTELYAGDILALALDEAYLYWFSSEPFDQFAIQRMPKGGGAPERLGTSTTLPRRTSTTLPRGLARSLVAHSSALFWAPEANYKVGQSYVIYSLLAGMQRPFVLADDPNGIAGIAADSNYVYWASNYTDAGRGRIMRVRRCGGPPEAVAENQDQPFDVAVDDSAVYWVNLGSQDSGSVMRMAKR